MMPQYRRFLGVNSVTNIELNKGDLPAPIIRNVYWFEKFSYRHSSEAVAGLIREVPWLV